MKFPVPRFLTPEGRQEVADARKDIARLEKLATHTNLLGMEEKRLTEARGISRRDFCKIVGCVAGAVTTPIAGYIVYKEKSDDAKNHGEH